LAAQIVLTADTLAFEIIVERLRRLEA